MPKQENNYILGTGDREEYARQEIQSSTFNAQTGIILAMAFENDPLTPQERTIAEIGIGTGRGTSTLAPYADIIIGIDPDENALKEAKQNLTQTGIIDQVELKQGSTTDIPLEDNSVDVLAMRLLLQHTTPEELKASWSEFKRVLKPGGKIIIEDLDAFGTDENGILEWMAEPPIPALEEFKPLFQKLYTETETQPALAKKLDQELEKHGFAITNQRDYTIISEPGDPFQLAHVGLVAQASKRIVKYNIADGKQVAQIIDSFEKGLKSSTIKSPRMYQLVAELLP